jgi:histidyl-tRNA synthetase
VKLAPPRGTRDFFPDDMRLRTWLFDHWRAVSESFGFEAYDAPVVEHEAIYIRKAGEEITGQLYNFEDKSGRRLALRPEMTPSLARMILQKGGALHLPAKWYSIPQCWRYERTTRGRKREHYQWNVDIFGVAGVTAEAELLAVITTFFQAVGIGPDDVGIKISSRKVLQSVLGELGVTDAQFAPVCVLVDKLEKVPRDELEKEFAALGLEGSVVDKIIETLSIRELDQLAEVLGAEHAAVAELRQLWELAAAYGYEEWLQLDASVVRGLAYYTGTVFEAFDRGATLRAICGGGRYDKLLSTFGGKDQPACGFGFGDVVILELLKDKGVLPEVPRGIDDVVFPWRESLRPAAVEVAQRLRAAGRSVDLILEKKKVKAAFKHADRLGAARMIMVAPDEWERGEVTVKDLKSGDQQTVAVGELG